ncbi:MAG: RtcB family protein [Myxococcota bacterium]
MARQGLEISKAGPVYRVKKRGSDAPEAEVLLPDGFPLEGKALAQLANFADVRHPGGGRVCAACATPDFHPGALVPVGAVVASADLVIPQAIGTDINCGMRLHTTALTVDRFMARKHDFVERTKGDLLLGTRDVPATVDAMRQMFRSGAAGWLDEVRRRPLGVMARGDFAQLEREQARIYDTGSACGDPRWAPAALMPEDRDVVRDGGLGTVGGGNHFVEVQVVHRIDDPATAWQWGVRTGQVAFMIHTGSRHVGKAVGVRWSEIARERWPSGVAWPEIFSLRGDDAADYVTAMNTAANYATVNRMVIAELVRQRMREVYGDLDAPLVFDVPHNIVTREGDRYIHRKGATPAHLEQPVLIPGSMGHASYLMAGCGNERFLSSCSHGAGRAVTRFEMTRKGRPKRALGLDGVECITLREERLLEEAPAAYKEIGPVVDVQVEHGLVRPVAILRPLLTFKA